MNFIAYTIIYNNVPSHTYVKLNLELPVVHKCKIIILNLCRT